MLLSWYKKRRRRFLTSINVAAAVGGSVLLWPAITARDWFGVAAAVFTVLVSTSWLVWGRRLVSYN